MNYYVLQLASYNVMCRVEMNDNFVSLSIYFTLIMSLHVRAIFLFFSDCRASILIDT